MNDILAFLQYREGNPETANPIHSVVHVADFVGTFIGGNQPTGGVIPPDSSLWWERVRIFFGYSTVHNNYGIGKTEEDRRKYWNTTSDSVLPKP
jgi:filamentous hemagglutinin